MKRTALGGGVYVDASRHYWTRPWINRRRTWRKLKATTARKAFKEAALAKFAPVADNFAALARQYKELDCPDKEGQPRSDSFCMDEKKRTDTLIEYFGPFAPQDINSWSLNPYYDWRKRQRLGKRKASDKFTYRRATDKDIQTLSNILTFGVVSKFSPALDVNKIRANRTHYQKKKYVRHARRVMPKHAEQIHAIAEYFFGHVASEVFGWLTYFSMFSGLRTSELLRLRLNPNAEEGDCGCIRYTEPFGFPRFNHIYKDCRGYIDLKRSKEGINPWMPIWPEFAQMLECFQYWHKQRFEPSDRLSARSDGLPYFPGRDGQTVVDPGAFGHALTRACKKLGLQHITPHGFRSYFTTKLNRDGFRDEDIAAAVGDKTVRLIADTYRDHAGGEQLSWKPKENLPGWLRWQDKRKKIVKLKA